MPPPPGRFIADAHQDIAFHCQEYGRDFADPGATPCMITLPWLRRGGVRLICATLFAMHRQPDDLRRLKLTRQVEMYSRWFSLYPDVFVPVRSQRDLSRLATAPPSPGPDGIQAYPVGVILLMEGLELLNSPAELRLWFERGVRLASISWDGVNRFGSGSFGDHSGLTTEGFALLKKFANLGMILDLSHLCDAGCRDVFRHFHGPLCATHSNARALCSLERNLSDENALELGERGGVIGLNLLAPLLIPGWRHEHGQPPLSAATAHTLHLAELIGEAHVGLGSDLDGGLTVENTPLGIERVDHLGLLASELERSGWTAEALHGFLGANWWRFFERSLPP
jgi:membrane dipeptidase